MLYDRLSTTRIDNNQLINRWLQTFLTTKQQLIFPKLLPIFPNSLVYT